MTGWPLRIKAIRARLNLHLAHQRYPAEDKGHADSQCACDADHVAGFVIARFTDFSSFGHAYGHNVHVSGRCLRSFGVHAAVGFGASAALFVGGGGYSGFTGVLTTGLQRMPAEQHHGKEQECSQN